MQAKLILSAASALVLAACAHPPVVSATGTLPAPGASVRLAAAEGTEGVAAPMLSQAGYRLVGEGERADFLADVSAAARPARLGIVTQDGAGADVWREAVEPVRPWSRRRVVHRLGLQLTDMTTGAVVYEAEASVRGRAQETPDLSASLTAALRPSEGSD